MHNSATNTQLIAKGHYDLMAMFEKDFSGRRFDKEPKALWSKGIVYQDGITNELFLAFRKGASYGKAIAELEPIA